MQEIITNSPLLISLKNLAGGRKMQIPMRHLQMVFSLGEEIKLTLASQWPHVLEHRWFKPVVIGMHRWSQPGCFLRSFPARS